MKLNNALALGIAAALGFAANANAGTITFDRNGAAAGGQILVDTFDWSPDNILFKNLITGVISQITPTIKSFSNSINNDFSFFGQGKLGNFISLSNANVGDPACQAAGDQCAPIVGEFTYEFGVNMSMTNAPTTTGTSTTIDAGLTANAATNYFKIFFNNPVTSNQSAGTGYTNATPILTGSFVDGALSFTLNQDDTKLQKLDNQGADGSSGVGTYLGNGSFQFDIGVDTQNNDFFKTKLQGLAIGMNITSTNATPFSQANPAASVAGNTPNFGTDTKSGVFHSTSSGDTGVQSRKMNDFNCLSSSSGAVGRSTCDFLAQSDGVSAFFNPIPEPTSLALMGAGLLFGGLKRGVRKARG